jgi:hypothetical protein
MTAANGASAEAPQTNLSYAYTAVMAAGLLILWAERKARARERELLKANKAERAAADEAIKLAADAQAGGALPTDTRAVLTEQGALCPRGLDHPVGTRVEGEECPACIAWAAEEAERARAEAHTKPPPPPRTTD